MEISESEYERLIHRSRLMDVAQDVLIVLDAAGTILDTNQAAAILHGTTVEALVGVNCADNLHPSSVDEMLRVSSDLYAAGKDGTDSMTLKAIRGDGQTVHLELRVSFYHAEKKFYVVERDVTEQFREASELQAHSETLRVLAATDTLTGISNRSAFDKRVAEVQQTDEEAWLVMLDLNRFKEVNDTLGHVVGDELLKQIASALSQNVNDDELVARVGGDEFAIIAPLASEKSFRARVTEIQRVLNRSYSVLDHDVPTTCSVGAARRVSGESKTDWLRRADRAMYDDKHRSRGQLAA